MATRDAPAPARPPAPSPYERLDEGRVQFRRGEPHLPRRPRGPKGYRRSDERIHEDLCERLATAARIDSREVDIQVQNGHVTLAGEVPERWMKYTIEDITADCPGVQDVDNRLRVPRGGAA